MSYQIQLEKHFFDSGVPGPHFVAAARIHGDEPSGETGSRIIIDEIHDGKIEIARGKVTILPLLNPLAKHLDQRGVQVDTNRDLTTRLEGKRPEDAIRRAIVNELRIVSEDSLNAGVDWHLLDLHSVPLEGKAHTILSEGDDDLAFAKAVGVDSIYTGWRDAQLKVTDDDLKALGYTREKYHDFTAALIYGARELGAKSSICLESGQNDDPASVQTAYQGIRNALAHHRLTNEKELPFRPAEAFNLVRFDQVLIRQHESEHLVDITHDAQSLKPGQVVLRGAFREVAVPNTEGPWLIAHPFNDAPVGRHCGFIAQRLG